MRGHTMRRSQLFGAAAAALLACAAVHSCRAGRAPLPSFMPGSCSPFPAGSRSRTRPSSSPTVRSGRSAPASSSPAHSACPPDTAVIDLRNKFVMPGFLDLHVHLSSSGLGGGRDRAVPRVRRLLLADRLAQRARDPDGRLHHGARPRVRGQRDLRLARCVARRHRRGAEDHRLGRSHQPDQRPRRQSQPARGDHECHAPPRRVRRRGRLPSRGARSDPSRRRRHQGHGHRRHARRVERRHRPAVHGRGAAEQSPIPLMPSAARSRRTPTPRPASTPASAPASIRSSTACGRTTRRCAR